VSIIAPKNNTANFLLRQVRFLRRVGSAEQKRDADRWEDIIKRHAEPEQAEPSAVNFATAQKPAEQAATEATT
jgi:hypothetical protein